MSETIRISTLEGDGSFSAYCARPEGDARAAIVVIQEIFGVNAGIRGKCDRLAEDGYLALAPDLFWRLEPGVELDPVVAGEFKLALEVMGRFAQDFLATANVRCRLDLPVQVPAWPLTAETRHNLFLAFKESLNNAVKHAAASEVRISLALRSDSFALVVKDNGHGFNFAQAASPVPGRLATGNGLTNMTARLARIGGRCEISSEPGTGTNVSFTVVLTDQKSPRPLSPSSDRPSIV